MSDSVREFLDNWQRLMHQDAQVDPDRFGVLDGGKLVCFESNGQDFFFFDSMESANEALRDVGLLHQGVGIIKITDIGFGFEKAVYEYDIQPTISINYSSWE